jgi:alkanesulfonate monooxygenase SsuD/methylene tetrahydromethanopterin reductase-like flavin-dependent oxidoreductase (luciferase family)
MSLRREALRRTDLKSRPGYVDTPSAADFDAAMAEGTSITGSPDTVRAAIEQQIEELGINYLICYFMFGTMTLRDALRSLDLFATYVKPNVKANAGAAARR